MEIELPVDWELRRFSEIVSENKKSQLKVSDASNFGPYKFYTSGENILQHNKFLVEGENVFLATGGVANVKYDDNKVAYSTDTYSLKVKDNSSAKLLYYHLLNDLWYVNYNYFEGSGLKHLQKKELRKHLLPYPNDYQEQQKIAEILTKMDDAIANTQAMIDKYENIKKGLMQDLLTKGIDEHGNIRSEETHKFKDSPLGRIPVEWESNRLGEISSITKLAGYEFTKYFQYKDEGEIIALRALNIKNESLILDDIKYIEKKISDSLIRSKLFKEDILMTYIGAYIGDVAMVDENDKYHLAPNICKITANTKIILPTFLEFILRSEKIRNYYLSLITTTANPSLTMKQIRNAWAVYPMDYVEQQMVCEKLIGINNYLKNLKRDYQKITCLKIGLMTDLLSGKVKVEIND